MAATFQKMGWADREVEVQRVELLDVLRKNRETHVRDYKLACAGYKKAAMEKLESVFADLKDQVNRLKAGEFLKWVGTSFSLTAPVSHEKSYDQAVRMMEMEVKDTVVLTASQFSCFVMDEWDWTEDFRHSNTPYFGGLNASWMPEGGK
jgi:hypothetical protein